MLISLEDELPYAIHQCVFSILFKYLLCVLFFVTTMMMTMLVMMVIVFV